MSRMASHAKAHLFDYLEVFYSQRRRHSAAGRMSPAAYERRLTQAAQLNRPPDRITRTLTRPRQYEEAYVHHAVHPAQSSKP